MKCIRPDEKKTYANTLFMDKFIFNRCLHNCLLFVSENRSIRKVRTVLFTGSAAREGWAFLFDFDTRPMAGAIKKGKLDWQ
jgi:hypothetical protein